MYTSSRLKVLRECPRKHFYRFVVGIGSPESPEMRLGTVFHAALEAWYRAWMAGGPRLAAAIVAINDATLDAIDKAKLRVLAIAYDARWGAEPWDVLAVEVEFRYELDGAVIGGKIDALIRDQRDGRAYIVEHKMTGLDASPGSPYWQRLAIDAQISIYVDGATMLGHEIAGCVYDVIQRPRHELRLATPAEKREYTQGKGCKLCGGNLQGKQGSGKKPDGIAPCAACHGSGWRLDESGAPEVPRLHKRMRDRDETLDEYEQRLAGEIADNPDAFLVRGVVVRLEDELPRMRQDLIDAIKIEKAAALFGLHPRNPDACARFNAMCSYFAICSGTASADDEVRFPRQAIHPELAAA